MVNELFEIFKRNFPFILREDKTVIKLLSDPKNKRIEKRDEVGTLIGVSVINKNTIYLMCVDKKYRNQGIGLELLIKSEDYVLENGYDNIQVGAGDDYLMPGIPTSIKPFEEELNTENIYHEVTNEASSFFEKRGYNHSWKEANCFDMRADLETVEFSEINIGDILNGIHYRWATKEDILKIIECTDDAEQSFSKYYKDEIIYENEKHRVLIATCKGDVCGTLIVNIETEGKGIGSVGCTTVVHNYRGKHIGVNMVILGTKYLNEIGLRNGYLGYTYSGLDRMYGYAGYKICIYYYMASKDLSSFMRK